MTRRTASELLRDWRASRSRRTFPVSSNRFVRVSAARLMDHFPRCVGLSQIIHNGVPPPQGKALTSSDSLGETDARSKTERPLQNPARHAYVEAVPPRDLRGGTGTSELRRHGLTALLVGQVSAKSWSPATAPWTAACPSPKSTTSPAPSKTA